MYKYFLSILFHVSGIIFEFFFFYNITLYDYYYRHT